MTQILASLDDINTHLPEDKLEANDANTELYQVDAARFIRAMLVGTFTPTLLATWVSPATTPDLIRSVAGSLIAAKYYATRYAEDADVSEFATGLYNDAMVYLNGIKNGTYVIVDVNDVPIATTGLAMSEDDFYPNASAPLPKFTMDRVSG